MKNPFIIDLFSGCGGFSLGASLAGIQNILSVDIDKILQFSYPLNFPNSKIINADVSKLTRGFWREILEGVRPDGVIGGPPCQGFSTIGKRQENDPRNTLVAHFFRNVSILDPKFFIMENVPGILNSRCIKLVHDSLEILDGRFDILQPFSIVASDYGAPTKRKRIFLIGFNRNEVNRLSVEDFLPSKNIEQNSVIDAIRDLPSPFSQKQIFDKFCWSSYLESDTAKLSKYAIRSKQKPPNHIGWKVAKKMLDEQKVSGFQNTKHSENVMKRYESIAPGKSDSISKSTRLQWEGFCPTLRAGTGSDRGSYQAVRPIHPSVGRVITVREAARLQGFPDWFVFHPTKWHSFRMMGNSVSPIVSKYILLALLGKF